MTKEERKAFLNLREGELNKIKTVVNYLAFISNEYGIEDFQGSKMQLALVNRAYFLERSIADHKKKTSY